MLRFPARTQSPETLSVTLLNDRADIERTKNHASKKLKEVQADTQSQRFCTTFNFCQRNLAHPPPYKKFQNKTLLKTLAIES